MTCCNQVTLESSRSTIPGTPDSQSIISPVSAWALSPKTCENTSRIFPNRQSQLFRLRSQIQTPNLSAHTLATRRTLHPRAQGLDLDHPLLTKQPEAEPEPAQCLAHHRENQ